MDDVPAFGLVRDYKSFFFHLEKKFNVISDCTFDSNGVLKCVYLQDTYMKDLFNFFPECLCIDLASKRFESNVYLFTFLVENSNSKNDIISFCFTLSEDHESIAWMLNMFKKHNPNWHKIKIIIADTELKNRDLLQNIFPAPYILICYHHAMKSFHKTFKDSQLNGVVSVDQFTLASDLFKNMYLAFNQAEYDLYYQQFMLLPQLFVTYFLQFWLPLQQQWRSGLNFFQENIFHSLNSTLQELDENFKALFKTEKSLEDFILKAFMIISLKMHSKTEIPSNNTFSQFSLEHCIYKAFTPYAAQFVVDNFHLSSEIFIDCNSMYDSYFFDNFGSPVNTTASICSCHFFLYTLLPCRHIFAVRRALCLNIFDESLVEQRWSLKYYQTAVACLKKASLSLQKVIKQSNVSLSSRESISRVFQEVLSLLLDAPEVVLNSCTKMLHEMSSMWKEEKQIVVQYDGVQERQYFPTKEDFSLNYVQLALNTNVEAIIESSNLEKVLPVTKEKKMEFITRTNWNFQSSMLEGKHINYSYLCRVICESKESCLDWLRKMELIPSTVMCPSCNCEMSMKHISRLSDGAVWVCLNVMENKRNCSRRCSVRQGSWFELTNMSFEQILSFCYMWLHGFSQNQIISEVGVSTATFISWNKWSQRVCEESLLADDPLWATKVEMTRTSGLLDSWLRVCKGEDVFLKFLQDANLMHRKDSMRHILR